MQRTLGGIQCDSCHRLRGTILSRGQRCRRHVVTPEENADTHYTKPSKHVAHFWIRMKSSRSRWPVQACCFLDIGDEGWHARCAI